jgi:hypothetical protein
MMMSMMSILIQPPSFSLSIHIFSWTPLYTYRNEFDGLVPYIKEAPEPSTIIWENLRYGNANRFWRGVFTYTVTAVLLFISVVVTLGAKYLQDSTAAQAGRKGVCPINFNSMSTSEQQTLVDNDETMTHCYCDDLDWVDRRSDPRCKEYFTATLKLQIITYFAAFVILLINSALGATLSRLAHFERSHSEEQRMVSIFDRLFLLRYINTSLVFIISNNSLVLGMFKPLGYEGQSTREFSSEWFSSIGVTIVLVQIGNIFGGHAVMFYKYLLYRYRCVFLPSSSYYCISMTVMIMSILTSASLLCLLLFLFIYSSPSITIRYRLYRARVDPYYVVTQDELNKLHEGPHFRFAESYATLLSTFFVCMSYNLGIPILNLIALINFIVYYFIDKALFIHVCSSPARINVKLNKRVRSLIPIAIVLHLCISIWTLCNKDVFSSDDTPFSQGLQTAIYSMFSYDIIKELFSGTIYEAHVFPLFVFLISLLALRAVVDICKYLDRTGYSAYLNCCYVKSTTSEDDIQYKNKKEKVKRGMESMMETEVTTSGGINGYSKEKKRCCGMGGGGVLSLVKKLYRDEDSIPEDSVAKAVTYPRAVQRNLIKGLGKRERQTVVFY